MLTLPSSLTEPFSRFQYGTFAFHAVEAFSLVYPVFEAMLLAPAPIAQIGHAAFDWLY